MKCDNCQKSINDQGAYLVANWKVIDTCPRTVCYYHIRCFDAEARRCATP